MPQPDKVTLCKVECECGWTDTFSAGYSGIIIECPECGKRHRIPMFSHRPEVDEQIDAEVMKRLLGEHMPQLERKPTVNFKPLFFAVLGVAVVIAVLAILLVRPLMPTGVAVAGGALSWPMAIAVAWFGQRRYLRSTQGTGQDPGIAGPQPE